ncbi:hypothetical protein [Streptomyces sp. MB09-02B]|uniref:hypothetical protein n=1 Tax=Streptomyces sp. MB09-02B TaxID=3028667 RepID=UPI0029AEA72D|nr:hypothetical protein [Streptomyces sp. MB09-02B]MDX3638574.1 hypothetical protein [Streptomyces sp. MB09-02B]
MSASHALVVSLRKSGTHLLKEVMTRLGYALHGEVSATADSQPRLKGEALWGVLTTVLDEEELRRLTTSEDRAAIDAAIAEAVTAFYGAWRMRLGIPWRGPEGEAPPRELVARVLTRTPSRFADTPRGVCWFLHQLDPHRVDEGFLNEWLDSGNPRIVFNYRDPRDVLLSMVNFLSGETGRGIGYFTDHRVYSGILRSAGSFEERLTIALTDPSFPGADAFERGLWLLRHPAVCKVSFEELVGPRGGGSREIQSAAVLRIADFLGAEGDADGDPAGLVDELFNDRAYSFHRGRIGAWREHFTPEHEKLFEERYGTVLDAYGYR